MFFAPGWPVERTRSKNAREQVASLCTWVPVMRHTSDGPKCHRAAGRPLQVWMGMALGVYPHFIKGVPRASDTCSATQNAGLCLRTHSKVAAAEVPVRPSPVSMHDR